MKIGSSNDDSAEATETNMASTQSTVTEDIKFREEIADLTFHGLKHFVEKKNPVPLRLAWAVAWLGTLGVFMWIYVDVMIDYNQYPFNTINQAFPRFSLQFPAITICNINSLDVSNVSYAALLKELIASFAFSSGTPSLNITPVHHEFLNMSAQQVLDDTAPVFEGTFIRCEYDDVETTCGSLFYVTYWGMTRCYTLNQSSLTPASRRTVFRLIININQAGYVVGRDKSAGVKFYIHDPDDVPNVDLMGCVASPGYSTHVAMVLQHFHFLPSPYKAFGDRYCVDTTTAEFAKSHGEGQYRRSSCFLKHSLEVAGTHCGCSSPYTDSPRPVCTIYNMYFCLLPKLHELNSDFLNVSDTLGCPRPCHYIAYHPTVSLSYFPSHVAEQELQRVGYVRNGTEMRSDFLELLFHFEEVIIYETKHVEVYTAKNLMGTIGGNMGFFLGASVLSICEILNVLLALCIVCAKRLSRKISGF